MISGEFSTVIIIILLILGAIYCFRQAYRIQKMIKSIEDIPTSKNRSIAMGKVEVWGKVLAIDKTFISPISGKKECIYCQWNSISRVFKRRIGDYSIPFILYDGTAKILVDLKGSELITDYSNQAMVKYIANFRLPAIKNSGVIPFTKVDKLSDSFDDIVSEKFIQAGDTIYILGNATNIPNTEDSEINKNDIDIMIKKTSEAQTLLVSNKNEKALLKYLKNKLNLYILICFVCSIFCVINIWFYDTLGIGTFWRWYKEHTGILKRK